MNTYKNNQSVRCHCAGRFLIVALLVAATMASCRNSNAPVQLFGEAQGTYYSVQYYDAQRRNLQPQVDSLLVAFDQVASLWVDSSLLRRINRNETAEASPLFADLLEKALWANSYTDGAFDCRIGRIVQVWGFSFKQREEPDAATLDSLLLASRSDVSLDGLKVVKDNPGTELDFNAIAQGYASDLVGQMLESYGITDYLVDIGGEVVARGGKPDGSAWRVGIERPAEEAYNAPVVQTAIALRDASVVTSGSYRKYYERDGVRYSHTIDPATGRPVQHTLLSVSVVESRSWLADAMATAYMVMGLERAKAFIAAHPDGPGTEAVLFIYDDHGTLATYATPAFEQMQIKQ